MEPDFCLFCIHYVCLGIEAGTLFFYCLARCSVVRVLHFPEFVTIHLLHVALISTYVRIRIISGEPPCR